MVLAGVPLAGEAPLVRREDRARLQRLEDLGVHLVKGVGFRVEG